MIVVAGRTKIATTYGIVAASQPLAARAGTQILERGGSAVDAAIAANAVMGLVEPEMNGVGGDLCAVVYDAPTATVYGLNAGGWAPSALTPALLKSLGYTQMPDLGIHSVTVPGAVAGWAALSSRFGRLPFGHVLAPAIFYAERGFPVSDIIAERWKEWVPKLACESSAAATYLIDGRAPRTGEVFSNPRLAATLRRIARERRNGFYRGETAEAILALSQSRGGTMTAADLAEYEAEWVTPISTTYRGWNVYELPPNTQGIAALVMLDLMEQFPLGEYGCLSADALHVMIEAKKLAYADMIRYVGDPRHADVPLPAMLDKAYARERARLIDFRAAAPAAGPSVFDGLTTSSGGDTIYLSAIDRHGNIVSLIQSIYYAFGSGLSPEGSGFMLHNRGALFTLDETHPNALAPRKRPLHTIIPGFMEKGSVKIGFGIMGGFNQAQAHAQFVSNVADHGLDVQHALEAARFTKKTFDGCDVEIESSVPEAVRQELTERGHELQVRPPRSGNFGSGQAVMSDGTGVHYGASEPRHDGAAIPEAPPVFG
jgi:gamma-glutamyltranspeptidase/glutathione hydrolase